MKPVQNGTPLAILLLVVANLAIPLAIVIFAQGFFPYKPMFPGLAEYDNSEYGPPPSAPFDRLIFMVPSARRPAPNIVHLGAELDIPLQETK